MADASKGPYSLRVTELRAVTASQGLCDLSRVGFRTRQMFLFVPRSLIVGLPECRSGVLALTDPVA